MTIDPSQFEPGTDAWMEAVMAATPKPDPRAAEIVRKERETALWAEEISRRNAVERE